MCAEQFLTKNGVSCKVDDSGVTVGKRYARTDENGIPFAITVDQVTISDDTVTVRYIDTMDQTFIKPLIVFELVISSFSLIK